MSGASSRAKCSAAMPSNCGIEKSDRMTWGPNSASALRNVSSVSATRHVTRMPARFSSRTANSASVGTSSASRTRIACPTVMTRSLDHDASLDSFGPSPAINRDALFSILLRGAVSELFHLAAAISVVRVRRCRLCPASFRFYRGFRK